MMASMTIPQINPTVAHDLELNLDEKFILDKSIFKNEFRPYIPDSFVLGDAVREVIDKINSAAAEQFSKHTAQNRSISLKIQTPSMKEGSNLFFYDQYCGVPSTPYLADASKTWLNRILQSLCDKGYIKTKEMTPCGYKITL